MLEYGLPDPRSTRILEKLSKTAFTYHALDRGLATWLKRDHIINLLKKSQPIRAHDVFKTVLTAEDDNTLRELTSTLTGKVQKCIKQKAFPEASECIQIMQKLSIIKHEFVTRLLGEAEMFIHQTLQQMETTANQNMMCGALASAQTGVDEIDLAGK